MNGKINFTLMVKYEILILFFHPLVGFKSLSKLQKLENLYLGNNRFNKTIFKQFSAFVSLKTLDLSGNYMGGPFPSQGTYFLFFQF